MLRPSSVVKIMTSPLRMLAECMAPRCLPTLLPGPLPFPLECTEQHGFDGQSICTQNSLNRGFSSLDRDFIADFVSSLVLGPLQEAVTPTSSPGTLSPLPQWPLKGLRMTETHRKLGPSPPTGDREALSLWKCRQQPGILS